MEHDHAGDAREAIAGVLAAADEILAHPPPCILDRTPSTWRGPARAYYSVGKYAWPSEETPDGLPYHRVDCAVNPAAFGDSYDLTRLRRLVAECRTLVLADFVLPDDRWLHALTRRLHDWFVDPDRSMEPHLRHAAALPGVNDGMWIGIIEGACLIALIHDLDDLDHRRDSLPRGLAEARDGVREWMTGFADWYRNSGQGRRNAQATNNHGLWYHLQLLTWETFAASRQSADADSLRRLVDIIAPQVAADGGLPQELARPDALGYTLFTLVAFAMAADELERAHIDLLTQPTRSGAKVGDAFLYLARSSDSLNGSGGQADALPRRAVLARWMARRLPGEPDVQLLHQRWWPRYATPELRVRDAFGLRSWL